MRGETAMVRSPSGDIDIITLFLAHDFTGVRVLLDNGVGRNRKIIDVTSSTLSLAKRRALVGLHAFSGNDYVSAFFRKGKQTLWKAMLKRQEFINSFEELGRYLHPEASVMECLEKFTCFLYGFPRLQSVNESRAKFFWKSFKGKNKVADLSLLPPCSSNLLLHIQRANYVAYIYRQADQLQLDLDSPTRHGWNAEGSVVWDDTIYPDDVAELLLNADSEEMDAQTSESESEDEFDDDIEDIATF